jgi:ribonuclease/clavin/mitogillin
VSDITAAASVLLARGPGSAELLAVRRAAHLRFFGGFYAFPGGKVHAEDADTVALLRGPAATPDLDTRRVTVVRELFEETGVLLARRADGSFPPSSTELDGPRRELAEGRGSFPAFLTQQQLHLWRPDLVPLGCLVTPPFTSMRFDTAFFVAVLPSQQQSSVWRGELDEGCWTTAADLLDRWMRGECLVSPPTVSLLEAIRGRAVDEAPGLVAPLLQHLETGAIPPICFAPRVQLIPLRTAGLPPSTHTNAYLVGTDPVYLLDPGPADTGEQQRLFALLDAHTAAGKPLTAIVLTHHHPDHVGAAAACAERYQVPIWSHPWTASALRGQFRVSRTIDDGERLDLGIAPDGSGPWHLEAIHTPGHAPGHLAFYEPHYRLLLAGDMVSTLSSIIIAPPHGDLSVYIESLRRLQKYDCRLLLPAHGSASARPRQTLEECITHRRLREEQLLAALAGGPRTVADLIPELYKGLPSVLTRLAELQTLAGLQKLQRQGQVEADGEGATETWRLAR